jgi:hypothetical protein
MTKQYLLMVDEVSMAILGKLLPSIKYVAVEGMFLKDNANYQMLVSPLPPQEKDPGPVEKFNIPESVDVSQT